MRPDVVHSHGYRADVVDAPVARRMGIPTVTTVHGFVGGNWKNRIYEWLQYRPSAALTLLLPCRGRWATHLLASGLSPGRVHVVPNAWIRKAPISTAGPHGGP